MGVVAITAMTYLKSSVRDAYGAVLFVCSVMGIYATPNPYLHIGILVVCGGVGQVLYAGIKG